MKSRGSQSEASTVDPPRPKVEDLCCIQIPRTQYGPCVAFTVLRCSTHPSVHRSSTRQDAPGPRDVREYTLVHGSYIRNSALGQWCPRIRMFAPTRTDPMVRVSRPRRPFPQVRRNKSSGLPLSTQTVPTTRISQVTQTADVAPLFSERNFKNRPSRPR